MHNARLIWQQPWTMIMLQYDPFCVKHRAAETAHQLVFKANICYIILNPFSVLLLLVVLLLLLHSSRCSCAA
jgi:hypothetical protein